MYYFLLITFCLIALISSIMCFMYFSIFLSFSLVFTFVGVCGVLLLQLKNSQSSFSVLLFLLFSSLSAQYLVFVFIRCTYLSATMQSVSCIVGCIPKWRAVGVLAWFLLQKTLSLICHTRLFIRNQVFLTALHRLLLFATQLVQKFVNMNYFSTILQ